MAGGTHLFRLNQRAVPERSQDRRSSCGSVSGDAAQRAEATSSPMWFDGQRTTLQAKAGSASMQCRVIILNPAIQSAMLAWHGMAFQILNTSQCCSPLRPVAIVACCFHARHLWLLVSENNLCNMDLLRSFPESTSKHVILADTGLL